SDEGWLLSGSPLIALRSLGRTRPVRRHTMSAFPAPHPSGGAMALRTPLYDWHRSHKGRMVEFAGWDMPAQYTSVIDEHDAVRTGGGLFDVSHMGRLSFNGPGAADLVQHVWTNNVAALKDFQVRYGLICNEQGGIRDDVLVYRWPYGWAMVVNASNREKIL